MALDPSISLAVRPPDIPPLQIVNPVQQFGQILSLRNLMTQGQSGQLELQSQALKLQQMQREMHEQQDYANFLKQSLNPGGTAPAGTPALGGAQQAGAIAPQPQAGGGPFDTSMIAPDFRLQGQSLNTLMTPPAAAPAVAPAAPPTTAPAPVAQDGGSLALPGGLNAGQFIARFPLTGAERLKQMFGLQQTQAEASIKQHQSNFETADYLGRMATAVRDSKDPPAQFKASIMDAVGKGYLPAPVGRQMIDDGYDAHRNDLDGFIVQAQNGKDYADTQAKNIAAQMDLRKQASQDIGLVNNQDDYTNKFLVKYPALRATFGDTFSPDVKDSIQSMVTDRKDLPKAQMDAGVAAAQILEPARAQGDAAFNAALVKYPKYIQDIYATAQTPLEVRQRALTAEQQQTAAQAAATLAQTTTRDTLANKRDQERIAAENRRIQIDQQKADAEYGPGTIGAAVSQIYANPDSVDKFLTPSNAGAIAQAFNDKYHLPLPTPLKGTSLDQETASKNTLADIDWIRNALKNPNIAKNIGPILGRLQNVEQATGAAVLTGADAEQAQELRSRMRTMLANEAAAMHARINPNTLNDLANSSGRVNMDAKMLSGALDGVEGFAANKLNGAERQRFGGQMRPPEARGIAPPPAALPPPPKSGDIITGKGGTKYLFLGGDPKDKSNYAPYTSVAH